MNRTQWKDWNGRLAVGIMGATRLDILTLNNAGIATSATTVSGIPAERVRSVVQGPDGALYIAAENGGEIWRVAPNPQVWL